MNMVSGPIYFVFGFSKIEYKNLPIFVISCNFNRTSVACEILDLTNRKIYQQNRLLWRSKIEKCNQEFIITEEGMFHPVSVQNIFSLVTV